MIRYRLSKKAEEDLRMIYRYTLFNHGENMAAAYLTGIEETLALISTNPALSQQVGSIRMKYKRYHYREHAIYWLDQDGLVYVVRVLHQQMKASLHLAG